MAGRRRQGPLGFATDRGVRPYPAVDGLSELGLGHRGRRARSRLLEEVRLGHRAQRPHPPGDAEGRGQRHLPHRALDRVSTAGAGSGALARPDEGGGRQVARHARHSKCHLQAERAAPRHRRFDAARLTRTQGQTSMFRTLMRGAFAAMLLLAAITAQAADADVAIDNFAFDPQELHVKVGTTVTWVNRDDIPHTVTSTTLAFRSKALDTNDKFSFTFT